MNPERVFARHWSAVDGIEPLGEGHINQTWAVTEAGRRWVLQRINRRVFDNPVDVMANIERVLAHVRSVPLPELRRTRSGETHAEVEGEVWRVWRFVEGGVARKTPRSRAEARLAASAYGAFQQTLRDLPAPPLMPPIGGFHRLNHHLARWDALRMRSAWDAVIDRHRALARLFDRDTGHVHGDCKFENLLLTEAGDRVLAILDLDTLMPGHWAFDWGDLVRSAFAVSGRPEPETFAALLDGFLPWLHEPTVEDLVLAPRYVASTLGLRFLVDHAQGDTWFRVAAHGDNLERAGRQFRFVVACESMEGDLRDLADQALQRLARGAPGHAPEHALR